MHTSTSTLHTHAHPHTHTQDSMELKTQELNSLKDVSTTESRKNKERLSSLFSDLREISTVLGSHGDLPLENSSDISDDDFARVRDCR